MPKSPKSPKKESNKLPDEEKHQLVEDFLKTGTGRKLRLATLMLSMEPKDDWKVGDAEKLLNSVDGTADASGVASEDILYAMCDLKLKQANPKLPDLLSKLMDDV